MLFNFTLHPLDRVSHWGEPGEKTLHWFGLTDGEYWIDAGPARLFEYAETFSRKHGVGRHLDYFVVRLHEDLLEMLPRILEPVPVDLVPCISGKTSRQWEARLSKWSDEAIDSLGEDRWWKIYEEASAWSDWREFNLTYLAQPPRLRMWSDADSVHIEWDEWGALFEGEALWSASTGSLTLSRAHFEEEVRAFDARLMRQMGERVEAVLKGAPIGDASIDLPGLEREHVQRCRKIEAAFTAVSGATDWKLVREAMSQIAGS